MGACRRGAGDLPEEDAVIVISSGCEVAHQTVGRDTVWIRVRVSDQRNDREDFGEMGSVSIRDARRGDGDGARPAAAGKERDHLIGTGDREARVSAPGAELGLNGCVARLVGKREIQPFEAGGVVVGEQAVAGRCEISGLPPTASEDLLNGLNCFRNFLNVSVT